MVEVLPTLDLRFIRAHPELVAEGARKKGVRLDLDGLLALDAEVTALRGQVQALRERRNDLSRAYARTRDDETARATLAVEARGVGEALAALEATLREREAALADWLLRVPNPPDPSVPEGTSEADNVEVARWGEPRPFAPPMADHLTLMQRLDLVDMERGSKVAGSRMYFLKRKAALLDLALARFALDGVTARGFVPFVAPPMAREFCFVGNGQFPTGRDQVYAVPEGDLFLVGTAEVSMTGDHAGDILAEADLPLRYVVYSPCFRREAGSYGRDVRGVIRVHQFTKVEQFVLCIADHDESVRWHEALRANAEALLKALELPYRVVVCCSGETGDGQVKKYDLECWLPSEGRFLETHSDSYFHDWQARRANIRYRTSGGEVRYVHMFNNTALASPRLLAPLFEHHQQPDGSIRIPDALRPDAGFDRIAR